MHEHRYILEPYKGLNSRFQCPKCKKTRTFSRYIDTESGNSVATDVGRCSRENNCGYHYTPRQYFQDNHLPLNIPLTMKGRKHLDTKPHANKISVINPNLFKASLKTYEANNFVKYLIRLFNEEIASKLISQYFLGSSKHWNGATIFWQIDCSGKIRTGKIMLYDPLTGKRVKTPFPHITWVHKVLNTPDFELRQCLFGEHLLKNSTKPVAIVESEKTAVISSIYFPEFLWLAVGSLNNLTAEKCSVLAGRTVILFPDLNGFDKWSSKAKELSSLAKCIVSDLLERHAIEAEGLQGLDLADYLVRFDFRNFINEVDPTPPDPVEVINPTSQTIAERQKATWTLKDADELDRYFSSHPIPEGPIKLDSCTTVIDGKLFVESTLRWVQSHCGNDGYTPYFEQLFKLKDYLARSTN